MEATVAEDGAAVTEEATVVDSEAGKADTAEDGAAATEEVTEEAGAAVTAAATEVDGRSGKRFPPCKYAPCVKKDEGEIPK